MHNIELLEQRLGVKFRDHMLLLSAITHRSYLNEVWRHPVPNNERLEFLGDSVLELVISEHLYLYHHGSEGEMTRARGLVVSRQHLGQIAQKMEIGSFILMSRGQAKDNDRAYLTIFSNCLEAIIGAIYLDKGYRVCQEFISRTVLVELSKLIKEGSDPKGFLQEKVQAVLSLTPVYREVDCTGPEHAKVWVCGVYVDETELGQGKGPSKKEAEINAAKDALTKGLYSKRQTR